MGKQGTKWLLFLLVELSLTWVSSASSFYNNTIHEILSREEMNSSNTIKQLRQRQKRRLRSHTSSSSHVPDIMTSTSKRLHTNIESTPSMPMTPGTLWRQTLLNKAFNHAREKSTLPSETEVLNSEHRNSFGTFRAVGFLFHRVVFR